MLINVIHQIVIERIDGAGLIVTECEEEQKAIVEAIKSGKRERDAISDYPMNIEGYNLDGDDPSKKRRLNVMPYDSSLYLPTETIHNLAEKSVFSSDVYINSEGTFDSVITWNNPTQLIL